MDCCYCKESGKTLCFYDTHLSNLVKKIYRKLTIPVQACGVSLCHDVFVSIYIFRFYYQKRTDTNIVDFEA